MFTTYFIYLLLVIIHLFYTILFQILNYLYFVKFICILSSEAENQFRIR